MYLVTQDYLNYSHQDVEDFESAFEATCYYYELVNDVEEVDDCFTLSHIDGRLDEFGEYDYSTETIIKLHQINEYGGEE